MFKLNLTELEDVVVLFTFVRNKYWGIRPEYFSNVFYPCTHRAKLRGDVRISSPEHYYGNYCFTIRTRPCPAKRAAQGRVRLSRSGKKRRAQGRARFARGRDSGASPTLGRDKRSTSVPATRVCINTRPESRSHHRTSFTEQVHGAKSNRNPLLRDTFYPRNQYSPKNELRTVREGLCSDGGDDRGHRRAIRRGRDGRPESGGSGRRQEVSGGGRENGHRPDPEQQPADVQQRQVLPERGAMPPSV